MDRADCYGPFSLVLEPISFLQVPSHGVAVRIKIRIHLHQMPTWFYLIELFDSKGSDSALSANSVLRYMGGTLLRLARAKSVPGVGLRLGQAFARLPRAVLCPASCSVL